MEEKRLGISVQDALALDAFKGVECFRYPIMPRS